MGALRAICIVIKTKGLQDSVGWKLLKTLQDRSAGGRAARIYRARGRRERIASDHPREESGFGGCGKARKTRLSKARDGLGGRAGVPRSGWTGGHRKTARATPRTAGKDDIEQMREDARQKVMERMREFVSPHALCRWRRSFRGSWETQQKHSCTWRELKADLIIMGLDPSKHGRAISRGRDDCVQNRRGSALFRSRFAIEASGRLRKRRSLPATSRTYAAGFAGLGWSPSRLRMFSPTTNFLGPRALQ